MDREKVSELEGAVRSAVAAVLRFNPGLDRDELLGEGALAALDAAARHDGGIAPRGPWLCHAVKTHLRGRCKYRLWRERFAAKAHLGLGGEPPARREFSLPDFLAGLSSGASMVVRVALEEGWRKTRLVRFLRAELGWTAAEVAKVWREIGEAL